MESVLSQGKLPADLLAAILARAPVDDPRVLLGPGIGLDCAVVDAGERLLVLKSDPITFASDELGYYLVQVNANAIATTGGVPRWLLVTLLLPAGRATTAMAETVMEQIYGACRDMGVAVVGGHSEISDGVNRPIALGALVGEVDRERLITPRGARPGDRVLLTKGVPIEATSILAREFPERLAGHLSEDELQQARDFLTDPGIGVLHDARVAQGAGRVTAMHDPTEGGLVTALWELAQASGRRLRVDPERVPIPALSRRVCRAFAMDPYHSIASGALLLTAPAEDAECIRQALLSEAIPCALIGSVEQGPVGVQRPAEAGWQTWSAPGVDEITKAYQ